MKTERDSMKKVYSEMKIPIPMSEVLGNELKIDIKINKLKEIEIVDFDEEVYQEKKELYQEILMYQQYNDLIKEVEDNYLEGMEKLNVPKNLNKYYQEYESLNQELKLLKSQIFEDEDKDLEIKKSKAELLLLDIEKYEQYLQLQKEKEKLDLLNKEVNSLIKKTEDCYKIKKIIQEESNVTFENLMISFNNILNDIVSEIFEDIYIEIGMFKKMKSKGDIKPQFNMKIVLKGNEYDNLNFLSGGEKDRISMALMITLAKLGRGNIVMLDETMSSLDETMRQEMLLLIKKHLQDKTVLVVCHSTVEGFHDSITRF
jgi:ABC-type dipeptide/oligopeptide/nickel transport system ATPase component